MPFSGWHFGLWILGFWILFKPTSDELFSERNGYKRVLRLFGLTISVGKISGMSRFERLSTISGITILSCLILIALHLAFTY